MNHGDTEAQRQKLKEYQELALGNAPGSIGVMQFLAQLAFPRHRRFAPVWTFKAILFSIF